MRKELESFAGDGSFNAIPDDLELQPSDWAEIQYQREHHISHHIDAIKEHMDELAEIVVQREPNDFTHAEFSGSWIDHHTKRLNAVKAIYDALKTLGYTIPKHPNYPPRTPPKDHAEKLERLFEMLQGKGRRNKP